PAILLLAACAPGPSPLLQPQPEAYARAAPDSFVVRLETTKGDVDIIVRRHWSPNAADRFHYLVRHGFYDDIRIFRVVPDFVAQFGLPGDTAVAAAWRQIKFADEPVRHSNLRGTLSFARGGENTRGTQVYINLRDNARLDTLNGFGFPLIATVIIVVMYVGGAAMLIGLWRLLRCPTLPDRPLAPVPLTHTSIP